MIRFAAIALIGAATPAIACQYEFAPEPTGGPSAQFFAPKMAAAATFVDLAIAEGAVDIKGSDGRPVPAKGLSFRVLQRWKGNSSDRFLLFGQIAPEDSSPFSWSLTHWVDNQGRVEPFESVREAPTVLPNRMTSCDPPSLAVTPGKTYLVLREADGRLLGRVEYHPGARPVGGTPISETRLWPQEEWARQMSYIKWPDSEARAAPPATPDSTHATIRFRRPLSPAVARNILSRAGAQPFAVVTVRQGVTADYRLSADQAWLGIIEDSVAWAARPSEAADLARSQAQMIVDNYAVRDVSIDAAKREHARAVLAFAETPVEQGPALIESVGAVADARAQAALSQHPEVAQVNPAARVRGRVATDNPPQTPAASRPLEPVELHRRLTAIAGREVRPGLLEGSWRLVRVGGVDQSIDRDQLGLRFQGGALTGNLSCRPLQGTFGGQALELDVIKPDVTACPKSETRWLAESFLEPHNKVVTVRLSNQELELIAEADSYFFVRD